MIGYIYSRIMPHSHGMGPFLAQGNIHVLRNQKGGRGSENGNFFIMFSPESNHKGEEGGVRKPKVLIT